MLKSSKKAPAKLVKKAQPKPVKKAAVKKAPVKVIKKAPAKPVASKKAPVKTVKKALKAVKASVKSSVKKAASAKKTKASKASKKSKKESSSEDSLRHETQDIYPATKLVMLKGYEPDLQSTHRFICNIIKNAKNHSSVLFSHENDKDVDKTFETDGGKRFRFSTYKNVLIVSKQ